MNWPEWTSPDGRIRLINADCLEVLPTLSGVDAVVTDPPYGIVNKFGEIHTRKGYGDGSARGVRKLEFAWDGAHVPDMVAQALRLALPMARACYVFSGFDHANRWADAARECGYTVKPSAWVKKCPPPAGKGNWWPSGFELAFYGYRTGAWFGDTDKKRCNVFVSDSYRHGQPGKVDHPTQKPLGLIRRIVKAIVPPAGGMALDPFAGSFTTAVACAGSGRRCIAIEKEPKYFDIGIQRVKDEYARTALFNDQEELSTC
jgi:site-specific DNA-methyltransferase (adenine-specific)